MTILSLRGRVFTPDKLKFFRAPLARLLHRWLFALGLVICGGSYSTAAIQFVRDGSGAPLTRDVANGRDARRKPGTIEFAQNAPGSDSLNETTSFDIPVQSLENALYGFSAATGTEVFADGSAVAGRRSSDVRGTLTIAQALRALLIGTGLEAHPIGVRAVTLSPIPQERSRTVAYQSFSANLQSAALHQLCREGDINLGTYRVAMQLWLNEFGNVRLVELLSSTGDEIRDRRIQSLLQGVSVGKPPATLPQPVVMVILPRTLQNSGDCGIGAVRPSQSSGGGRRESSR